MPDDAMVDSDDDSVIEVPPEPKKKVVIIIKEGYKAHHDLLTPSQTQSQNTVFSGVRTGRRSRRSQNQLA